MRVLVVTSEWPSEDRPNDVPFLVEQVVGIRRAGADVDVFHFRGGANPLRYTAAWRRLRATRLLREFDIVHTHFGQAGLVSLPCPVPLVVTFHGSDLQGLPSRRGWPTLAGLLLGAASRLVARGANRVVIVSSHLRKFLPDSVHVEVIPCGIDLDRFRPMPMVLAREKLGLPENERLVLFVGDPTNPIKNRNLAVDAVDRLNPALNTGLLSLHGEPHDRIPLYMNACDALLVTSLHEGSPTVVKEALACNLPVVSLPVGDVPERISGVEGCELCASADPSALAAGLARVISRGRRCEGGRESVKHLDHPNISARLIEVYQGLCR